MFKKINGKLSASLSDRCPNGGPSPNQDCNETCSAGYSYYSPENVCWPNIGRCIPFLFLFFCWKRCSWLFYAISEYFHVLKLASENAFFWIIYSHGDHFSKKSVKEKEFAYIHRNNKWATTWQNQQSECAPSEDSDQPGHPPSLIRVFVVRMKKPWALSYPLSAQRRLWSDWADA